MGDRREKIIAIIIEAARELNEEWEIPEFDAPSPDSRLFGKKGNLDSMGLVALMADVEERVFDAYQKGVILADEKAMSRSRSPFATIESLAEYVEDLLEEDQSWKK